AAEHRGAGDRAVAGTVAAELEDAAERAAIDDAQAAGQEPALGQADADQWLTVVVIIVAGTVIVAVVIIAVVVVAVVIAVVVVAVVIVAGTVVVAVVVIIIAIIVAVEGDLAGPAGAGDAGRDGDAQRLGQLGAADLDAIDLGGLGAEHALRGCA